jgi:hypothetical protein
VQGGACATVEAFETQLQEKEDRIMRLLVLAAAATLVITGTAMADESNQTNVQGARHHHYRNANASIARSSGPVSSDPVSSAPAETLSAHDLYMRNLRDSGHNPASDVDANGYFKGN